MHSFEAVDQSKYENALPVILNACFLWLDGRLLESTAVFCALAGLRDRMPGASRARGADGLSSQYGICPFVLCILYTQRINRP